LRDLLRVLAHWPRDRYLELAPFHWWRTRERLNAEETAREIGPITLPAAMAPEQAAAG
jgi:hypothetical protein